jgi:hypothetical protein
MEPKDFNLTSSPSIAKNGDQHSDKEVATSKELAVIQSGKPDLSFHPE